MKLELENKSFHKNSNNPVKKETTLNSLKVSDLKVIEDLQKVFLETDSYSDIGLLGIKEIYPDLEKTVSYPWTVIVNLEENLKKTKNVPVKKDTDIFILISVVELNRENDLKNLILLI